MGMSTWENNGNGNNCSAGMGIGIGMGIETYGNGKEWES